MVFRSPPTIIYGKGTVTSVGEQAARFGKRAVLVCGKGSLRKSGVLDIIVSSLEKAGVSCAVYDRVGSDPTTSDVDEGAAFAKENGCDVIVAAGGGSPLDAAKGIGMLLTNGGKVTDYEKTAPEKESLPIIAIPTTAGTGSEATRYSVITDTDRNIKMLLSTDGIIPKVAILDFAITKSLPSFMTAANGMALGIPKQITAATGMDALTHAIESYINVNASPMTKMYSLEAIRLISKSLIPAVLDGRNELAREDMLLAALYAGIAICSAPTALVHSMSRPLGAWFHIPHGLANAMLLSTVMEYNRPSCPEKFRDIAIAMGENVEGLSVREASIAAVEAIAAIADETGLPKLLSSQGVTEDKIPTLAKDAFAAGSTANNPRVPTVEEIETIYKSIF